MASSPTKDLGDGLTAPPSMNSRPAFNAYTQAPPAYNAPLSPRTHRTLRRLNSAHTLGASNRPSLIAQQRQQQQLISPYNSLRKKDSPEISTATQNHNRVRSNSDASGTKELAQGLKKQNSGLMRKASEHASLDRIVRDGPGQDMGNALDSMRLKILDQGIKSDGDGMSSLRIYVWLILLNAPVIRTDGYLALIHRGASPAYSKIRNDTFRTLATDPLFRRRVSEASLIRLLNAVAWKLHDAKILRAESLNSSNASPITSPRKSLHSGPATPDSPDMHYKNRVRALTLTTEGSDTGASEPGTYVQGMNVLAAPFLYAARSESEAFVAFHRFITYEVPGYVRGAMDGVHKGLSLVDRVLAIVDPRLSLYLMSKGMHAELYAFPSVLTLCACTPPLPEVLRLWDFLFAYGSHLNILCIVAQLVMMRNQILSSPR